MISISFVFSLSDYLIGDRYSDFHIVVLIYYMWVWHINYLIENIHIGALIYVFLC